MKNSMSMLKCAVFAALTVFCASTTEAASPTATLLKTRASYNEAVTTGKWQSNFYKARKYAVDNGIPFVAVWSNGDACGHCIMFENGCNTTYFKNWMKTSGYVFYFTYYGDKGDGTTKKSGKKADDGTEGSDIFHWCRNNKNTGYPFIRIYWPKGKVDIATIGDTVDGNKDNTAGAKKSVAYFKGKLRNYTPTPEVIIPKYTGGHFVVGDTEGNRLEAITNITKSVEVPLARTNSVVSVASTNKVVWTYPGNAAPQGASTIYWAAGEDEKSVAVDIPASMATVGSKIEVILLDDADKGIATSHVTMVDMPANSPSNPLWIDEKTADDLDWGEWTMDIDAATNKVCAYNAAKGTSTAGKGAKPLLGAPASDKDRAYTLLLLEGSLWCPDCHKTDENLFLQDKFKTWAQENKVALVAIDLPYVPKDTEALLAPLYTAPTLLTCDSGTSFITGSAASGAPYLSRKMVDKDDALDALLRNFEIAYSLRYPNWTNKNRPPVPSLFLLRDDGTVAGRIQYFGGVESPVDASDIDLHLKRLDELLLQADNPEEEANDKTSWTAEVIGLRTNVVDKTVSFIDEADVYRLDPGKTFGKRMSFTLIGEEGVNLQLKVTVGGETVAEKTGTGEVSVAAKASTSNCHVTVSYEKREYVKDKPKAVDPRFSITNATSSLCAYELRTDFVVEPTELAADNHIVIEDGVNEVWVNLASNQMYRITNLDTSDADNLAALEPTNWTGSVDSLYVARLSADVRLRLAAGETDIQKWNVGSVGFAVASASVPESAVSYTLRMMREGGVSGRAAIRLSIDKGRSSKYYESLVSLPDGFGDEIVWEEGESDTKTLKVTIVENNFADGDQAVYFNAEASGDAAPGIDQFRLALRDNDKRIPGKIAITGTRPVMAKAMTTIARAGADVVLELTRVGGSSGGQDVTVATSGGALDETAVSWLNREADAREVKLTLPASKGTVKVAMTPAKGSAVDGSRRTLTVNVLDSDVPGFESDFAVVSGTNYVPIAEVRIALDDKATDETVVKKYSGTLPAGVSWRFDKDAKEVVLSGVPTNAGEFTAVFRASTGKTDGLTTAVTFFVIDPVKQGGGDDMSEPLNASVAMTRTFTDVPVLDSTTNLLEGVLTLTIPRSGRLSAKFRGADMGAFSLSCKSWSGIEADGTLVAELTGKTAAGDDCSMTVLARADGSVGVEDFVDPSEPDDALAVLMPGDVWSKKNPATDFKGYYTVSMPILIATSSIATGSGYATLKMNTAAAINAGKFTYAGVLPDGRAFSGSATATPADWKVAASSSFWGRAVVPVVSIGSLNTFAGAFQINPGAADSSATNMVDSGKCAGRCYYKQIRRSVSAADEAYFYWRHDEKSKDASYEAILDAQGTYYAATDNIAACCAATFLTNPLKFFVQDEGEGDSKAWPTNGAPVVTVKYTSKTKTNSIAASKNNRGLTLSFAPSTGIVSGTFMLDGEKMTYKGVVLPGWGSDECTACGYSEETSGGVEAQLRPFISGTAWYNDNSEFFDERERTISVRRSCQFSIGTQSGK